MRKTIFYSLGIMAVASSVGSALLYWQTQQSIATSVKSFKRAVTKDFHDPESARFRSVSLRSFEGTISERLRYAKMGMLWEATPSQVLSIFRYDPNSFMLCGEVNAKNGFGAYIGYKRFYISPGGEPLIDFNKNDDYTTTLCEIGKSAVLFTEPDQE